MATGDEERDLSPVNLQALGRALGALGAETEALKLLRAGQSRYPNDLWINFDLAQHLSRAQPPAYDEAIRFYTVAAALHPGSAGIHINLGGALYVKGRLDEAIAEFRKAIELNPDLPLPVADLALALKVQGRFSESLAAYRRARELAASASPPKDLYAAEVREEEDFVRLDVLLDLIRRGQAVPALPVVAVQLAKLCFNEGRYGES